jgi:hypothetical protein
MKLWADWLADNPRDHARCPGLTPHAPTITRPVARSDFAQTNPTQKFSRLSVTDVFLSITSVHNPSRSHRMREREAGVEAANRVFAPCTIYGGMRRLPP